MWVRPRPITTANQALDPEESETLELGAKYSLFDGALGLTGSLFKVLKSNALITDPVSGNVQLQSGQKQRVQGLELSATGKITDDLSMSPPPIPILESGDHLRSIAAAPPRPSSASPIPTPSASR